MRCLVIALVVAILVVTDIGDVGARDRAGSVAARSRATRAPRTASPHARAAARQRRDAAIPASAFECDTPRGAATFGSTDRCLRALCAEANRTNAYVLDAVQRLRRNPCAGVDPFEHHR